MRCQVRSCLNTTSKNRNITFFSIPKDPERRSKWLQLISREDLMHEYRATVCEMHFSQKYIKKTAQHNILTKDAIPTLSLTTNEKVEKHTLFEKGQICSRNAEDESKINGTENQFEKSMYEKLLNIEIESYTAALTANKIIEAKLIKQENIETHDERDTVNYFTDIQYEIPIVPMHQVIPNIKFDPGMSAISPSEDRCIQTKPIKQETIEVQDESDEDHFFTGDRYEFLTHKRISNIKIESCFNARSFSENTLIPMKGIKQETIEVIDDSDEDDCFSEKRHEHLTHKAISNNKTKPCTTESSTSEDTLIQMKPIQHETDVQYENLADDCFTEELHDIVTGQVISNIKNEPCTTTAISSFEHSHIPIKQEAIEVIDDSDEDDYFAEQQHEIETHQAMPIIRIEPCTTSRSSIDNTRIPTKAIKHETIEVIDDSDEDDCLTEKRHEILTHPAITNNKIEPCTTVVSPSEDTLIQTKPIKQETEVQYKNVADDCFTEELPDILTHQVISNIKDEPFTTASSPSESTLTQKKPLKQETKVQDENFENPYFTENQHDLSQQAISNIKIEPCTTAISSSEDTLIHTNPIKQQNKSTR